MFILDFLLILISLNCIWMKIALPLNTEVNIQRAILINESKENSLVFAF